MPKSFDLQQDLEFEIAGEKFLARIVRPEVIAAWEDEGIPEKSEDALKRTDERIEMFLDQSNGQLDRWRALRARDENPVSMGQLNRLLMWLVEIQTSFPTEQPSPSASGRGRAAATSAAR